MKIVVDWSKCTGIGICESLAPEFYEIDDEGTLVLLQGDVSEGHMELIKKSVIECPTVALSLEPR